MMRQVIRAGLVAALVAGGLLDERPAASIVPPVDFDTIVRRADLIFTGEVLRVEPRWVTTSAGRSIVTTVTFRVERVFKGDARDSVSLEFLGGRLGDVGLEVPGSPRFQPGQRDVICARGGEARVSPIVGFNQGRFRVNRDPATGRDYVTTHAGHAFGRVSDLGRPLPSVSRAPVMTMTLDAFEREIVRVRDAARR
jgi:hypothetical protein